MKKLEKDPNHPVQINIVHNLQLFNLNHQLQQSEILLDNIKFDMQDFIVLNHQDLINMIQINQLIMVQSITWLVNMLKNQL